MQDGGMHDGGMGPWMRLWMGLWGLVGIAVLVLAAVAIVFPVRSIRRIDAGGPGRSGEVADVVRRSARVPDAQASCCR